MKTDHTVYRPAARLVLAAAFILLLPFLAMQITDELVWDPADFAVAGALLSALVSYMSWQRGRRAISRTEPPSALRSWQHSSSSG